MPATITRETIEEKIVEAVAELGPQPSQCTPDATFASLDIDSLDLIELAQMIEEDLGVWITAEDAEQLQTLGDVYDLVWQRAQQA
jgi:acyl carrier protein